MADAPPTRAPSSGRLRVLFVDDDPLVLRSYGRTLASRFDVVLAASGAEALVVLQRDRGFDAVITDLAMPQMSGIELYRRAIEAWPETSARFLFVTGGAHSREVADFLARSGRPCIEKPVSAAKLVELVQRTAART